MAELTEYPDRPAAQAMSAEIGTCAVAARCSPRIEGLPIIVVFVLLLGLFMYTAPQVFLAPNIYTTFLSTLPPLVLLAVGLTFVIGAGEIDLSFPSVIAFSGFVFAVLFKEYDLGWLAVVLALARGAARRLRQRRPGRQGRHPLLHRDAGTQFFWSGMATVLSGGKSYALRGAERARVWQLHRRPAVRRRRRPSGWTSSRCRRCGRRSSSSSSGSSSTATASASTCCSSAIRNDVSRVVGINVEREKIKLFTLMGGLAARRRHHADAGEQELLRQPGPGLSADRDRLGADRRHLDLRRAGDHRRHGVRLLHHRHDRGGAGRHRASPAPGCAPSRASCSWPRSSSISTSTSRSAGRLPGAVDGRARPAAFGRTDPQADGCRSEAAKRDKRGHDAHRTPALAAPPALAARHRRARRQPSRPARASRSTCRWAAMPATAPRSRARPAPRPRPRPSASTSSTRSSRAGRRRR